MYCSIRISTKKYVCQLFSFLSKSGDTRRYKKRYILQYYEAMNLIDVAITLQVSYNNSLHYLEKGLSLQLIISPGVLLNPIYIAAAEF